MNSNAEAAGWTVARAGDEVVVIRFDGGRRRTMTIADAQILASLVEREAERPEPPVLALQIDIVHADLDEVSQLADGRPLRDWAPWVEAITAVETYPSATVAAVQRQATCGGLELSLAADFIVTAPEARLGVLEARMGIMTGAGGSQRLARLVGHSWAAVLCFSGQAISGREAFRIGLAQILAEEADTRAVALAELIAANGPNVVAGVKRALVAARAPIANGLRAEGRAFLDVVSQPASRDRMNEWRARLAAGANPAFDASPLP